MALPSLPFTVSSSQQPYAQQQFERAIQKEMRQFLWNVGTILTQYKASGAGAAAFRTAMLDPTSNSTIGASFLGQMLAQSWVGYELNKENSSGDFDNIPG